MPTQGTTHLKFRVLRTGVLACGWRALLLAGRNRRNRSFVSTLKFRETWEPYSFVLRLVSVHALSTRRSRSFVSTLSPGETWEPYSFVLRLVSVHALSTRRNRSVVATLSPGKRRNQFICSAFGVSPCPFLHRLSSPKQPTQKGKVTKHQAPFLFSNIHQSRDESS